MRKLFGAFFVSLISVTAGNAAERDPLHVVVSLDNQHLKVYRGAQQIAESNISSGKKGHITPTGIFSVLQKNKHHRSNIYNNAPMPFMQRLTWSGIALHASKSVPRYPASHGCIRMPHSFASKLFKMRTNGAHVVIENETTAPQLISHSALFQPIKTWQTNADYDGWVNAHINAGNDGFVAPKLNYPARIFITRRTMKDDIFEAQRLLKKIGFDAGEVDGLMGAQTATAISDFQIKYNILKTGLISNELLDELYARALEFRPPNGQILVRQHHKTVFKGDVNIRDPQRPLGSHLITTSKFDRSMMKTEWVSMSLKDRVQKTINLRTEKEIDKRTARYSTNEALSRIDMDEKTREQISRLLMAGSSLTISDNGMSMETGAKGTDFIVLTKPQKNNELIAVTGITKDRG